MMVMESMKSFPRRGEIMMTMGQQKVAQKTAVSIFYTHDPVGGNHNISKLNGPNNAAGSYFGYSMRQFSTIIMMVYLT